MYDIKFFQNVSELKQKIVSKEFAQEDAEFVLGHLEELRNEKPFVFNIETTNYCNMRCVMCPRTSLMTRKNMWIDDETFEQVLDQICPHTKEDQNAFWDFVKGQYSIGHEEQNENHFYFYVVSRCLILHGYGEPLLDKKILDRVQACTKRGIPTYFSCVPANIDLGKVEELMKSGLTVLKFSMDALNDEQQKEIRGKQNNFDASYNKILEVLNIEKTKKYDTKIVMTMIELGADEKAKAMHEEFLRMWRPFDVYVYVKSQDNRWYFEEDEEIQNNSHYEHQYCEYPWTSLTVMADGSIVPCTQDYDAEMCFGHVQEQSLVEIWNSEKYREFRQWHVTGQFPSGFKCSERCDQKKLHSYLDGSQKE